MQTVTVEAVDADAMGGDQSASSTLVTCKLLDCDTISQAKLKLVDALHANMARSRRPRVDHVELCESFTRAPCRLMIETHTRVGQS